jgi:hypothetical protein
MSLFEQFETDSKKESEGAEVTFPPNKDGSIPTFIIAATSRNNQKYAKALDRATKPYRRNLDAMGDANAERIYREVFVTTVLKGWKNVQNADGSEIPFSIENANILFDKLPRLYNVLNERANSIELFQDQQREAEAGN